MENRYQGKWSPIMLAEYCWTVVRDSPERVYKRQAKKRRRRAKVMTDSSVRTRVLCIIVLHVLRVIIKLNISWEP